MAETKVNARRTFLHRGKQLKKGEPIKVVDKLPPKGEREPMGKQVVIDRATAQKWADLGYVTGEKSEGAKKADKKRAAKKKKGAAPTSTDPSDVTE